MKNHKTLLTTLLKTLVEEWGSEQVAEALATVSDSSYVPLAGKRVYREARSRQREVRLSATAQIERAQFDGDKRAALLELAQRYDQKQFLPSVADVREFLIMMGERPGGMKDRNDAFRVLARSLGQLPIEQLQQLTRTAQHSGPSELGPLSDAIAAAGQRLPRQNQAEMVY